MEPETKVVVCRVAADQSLSHSPHTIYAPDPPSRRLLGLPARDRLPIISSEIYHGPGLRIVSQTGGCMVFAPHRCGRGISDLAVA
jgi:hypothetical protein